MTSTELLVCIFLIGISGYLSASEVALFSLSRFQLRTLREQVPRAFARIKRLLADPPGLLLTILVINEICNVSISTIISSSVAANWPDSPMWVKTLLGVGLTVPIFLLLCEVTPKAIGARLNQVVAPLTSGPLVLLYRSMRPFRVLFRPWKKPALDIGGAQTQVQEDDFMLMLERGHREGMIHSTEFEMVKRVFDLDDTPVEEIMIPIAKVVSLPETTKLSDAAVFMEKQGLLRVPIFKGFKTKITGVLYAKDLLSAVFEPSRTTTTIADLMREPFQVQPKMQLNSLFRQMRMNQVHLVVVKDGRGRALGIVTMTDVLNELFEDFGIDLGESE